MVVTADRRMKNSTVLLRSSTTRSCQPPNPQQVSPCQVPAPIPHARLSTGSTLLQPRCPLAQGRVGRSDLCPLAVSSLSPSCVPSCPLPSLLTLYSWESTVHLESVPQIRKGLPTWEVLGSLEIGACKFLRHFTHERQRPREVEGLGRLRPF